MRNAANKVRGAVQRVYHPAVLGIATAREAAFLGKDSVIGKGLVQMVDNVLLGLDIDFGNKIVDALGLHLETIQIVGCAHDKLTGLAGGAQCDIDHRFHEGSPGRSW